MENKAILRIPDTKADLIPVLTEYMATYDIGLVVNPEGMNDITPCFIVYDDSWRDEIIPLVLDRLDVDAFTFLFWAHNTPRPMLDHHDMVVRHTYFDTEELEALMAIGAGLTYSADEESFDYMTLRPRDRFYLGMLVAEGMPYFPGSDMEMADEVWRSAAADGDYNATMRLKLRNLEDADGRIPQFSKALPIYKELGPRHILTMNRWLVANGLLGMYPALFDPEEGMKWLIPAALEDENPYALAELASAYSVGKWGMPEDGKKAAELNTLASEKGHTHLYYPHYPC